jgi:hypothetical protein
MSLSVSVPDDVPAFADVFALGMIVPPLDLCMSRLCLAIQMFSQSAMFFPVGFSS